MTRASICMATCNGERYIDEQLESILAQLGAEDEIIICDDGSTDATLHKIRRFADPRIRVIESKHAGISNAFDRALSLASGQYLFLADQDDVWLPGRLAEMCDALATHILVVTDCAVVDSGGNMMYESYFALLGSGPGLLRNLLRNSYLGCCMAFRRELLKVVLPIPRDVPHDYWIGMLSETVAEPYFLRRKLLLYRRHASTASFAAGKSGRPISARIGSRVKLATRLAGRISRIRALRAAS